MREAPDLALEFNGEQLYAEVKHFRLKDQDLIDNAQMSEPGDILVPYGDIGEVGWTDTDARAYHWQLSYAFPSCVCRMR